MGLLNVVVPGAEAFATVLELADAIAANSPAAMSPTRRLVEESTESSRAEAWHRIREASTTAIAAPEVAEGARAFLERRTPRWH